MKFLLVFAGGGLGAMARYFVTTALAGKFGNFPLGTLTANILGSFLMGLVVGIIAGRSSLEPARLFLAVGFLGGFTTFSTFSAETLTLMQNGQIFSTAANIIISVALGIAACFAGITLARQVF